MPACARTMGVTQVVKDLCGKDDDAELAWKTCSASLFMGLMSCIGLLKRLRSAATYAKIFVSRISSFGFGADPGLNTGICRIWG